MTTITTTVCKISKKLSVEGRGGEGGGGGGGGGGDDGT